MSTINETLAEGAKNIKAAIAGKSKKPAVVKKPKASKPNEVKAKKKPAAKKTETKSVNAGTMEVIPPAKVFPSSMPIQEILSSRVKLVHHNTGLEVAKETTLEEHLAIYQYFAGLETNAQYLIGDAINAGQGAHGTKYDAACAATEYSLSTLKTFALVARKVPAELRDIHPALTFTHVREVARIEDKKKQKIVLEQAAERIIAGETITKADVKRIASRIEPPKAPKAGKTAKAKNKKNAPPPEPEYVPTTGEEAIISAVSKKLDELFAFAGDGTLKELVLKLDNKRKQAIVDLTKPIADLHNAVAAKIGY